MKNKIIILIAILFWVILFWVLGSRSMNKKDKISEPIITEDSKRFAEEYLEVTQNNVFIYETPENVINLIKNGTGIIYLGYPECKWCQAYVKYLNDVAKEVGIQKIFYINTRKLKENNLSEYYKIIELLNEYLPYNNGKLVLYVPNITFVINGKIIANDNNIEEEEITDPKQYWNDKRVIELKQKLEKYMREVLVVD